jgi:copper transport protein
LVSARVNAVLRAVAVFGILMVAILLPARPAQAHAALLEATPADGKVLPEAPQEVVLRYNEAVGVSLGAVKVLNPEGERVDLGEVNTRSNGTELVVPLRERLDHGTYLISWRVVSRDSHPVSGASTFSVGHPSTPPAAQETVSNAVGPLLVVSRLTSYAGIVLLIGGLLFLLLLWPEGRRVPAARVVLWSGWVMAAAGTLAGLLLQGPYAAGLPLADALHPTLLSEVAASRYGIAGIVRFLLLLLLGAATKVWLNRSSPSTLTDRVAFAALIIGVALSTSAAGHAGVGDLVAVALPADAIHLIAASAWIGGLVVLGAALLPRLPAELAELLPRWSRLAMVAVALIVATGLFASWREVRELPALPATLYGRLLLIKVALITLMLALGAAGQRWVSRRYSVSAAQAVTGLPTTREQPQRPAEVLRLRRSIALEAATAGLVLAVTAVLVRTPPARTAFTAPSTQLATLNEGLRVQVDLEPLTVGVNQIHVYYTGKGGKALNVKEATGRFTYLETGEVIPVEVPHSSLGHYEDLNVVLPYAGEWRLELTTRTSDVDAVTEVFGFEVR